MKKQAGVKGRVWNSVEAAEFFDVRPGTIREWTSRGCPYLKRGGKGIEWHFDSAALIRWRIDYLVKLATGEIGDRGGLTTRKHTAETGIKEMEFESAISQVVPLPIFLRSLEAIFDVVRRQLDKIAPEAAPLVARQADLTRCHLIIAEAINKARIRIQADARKLPELEKP